MIRRIVWGAFLLGALYFTLQAGEFTTHDIVRQRARRRALAAAIDSLQHEVDSLRRIELMVRTDSATQERIAREEFGMVRGDNEIRYRFVSPSQDSVTR